MISKSISVCSVLPSLSAMASPEEVDTLVVERSGHGKQPKKGSEFLAFLWNGEKHEFLGRTGGSWARIGLFYLIFYSLLAGFWAGLLAIFFQTINENRPTYSAANSVLRGNPGLGFRPMPDFESTLIRFEKGLPSSYKIYADQMQAFMEQYSNVNQISSGGSGGGIKQCNSQDHATADSACVVDINAYKDECTWVKMYGYEDGMPCVFLKMNKLYGWEPDVYANSDELYNDQALLPDGTKKGDDARRLGVHVLDKALNNSLGSIGISCEGISDSDKLNLGPVTFFPPSGIRANYFPYLNQEGYRQPGVFAQFQNITNGILIMVRCRLWAKNVKNYDFNSREGAVQFELLVD